MRTLTLFVGNNRLQLKQLDVRALRCPDSSLADAHIPAVMLRPIGAPSMLRLMLHGAMVTLCGAQGVGRYSLAV